MHLVNSQASYRPGAHVNIRFVHAAQFQLLGSDALLVQESEVRSRRGILTASGARSEARTA